VVLQIRLTGLSNFTMYEQYNNYMTFEYCFVLSLESKINSIPAHNPLIVENSELLWNKKQNFLSLPWNRLHSNHICILIESINYRGKRYKLAIRILINQRNWASPGDRTFASLKNRSVFVCGPIWQSKLLKENGGKLIRGLMFCSVCTMKCACIHIYTHTHVILYIICHP
jgi:hypothetical protein